MTASAPVGDLRTTLTASAALITATLPVFLIGAMSDAIRDELGIGETAIGAAVTVLLGTAGVFATSAGRITERIGAPVALRIGVTIAGTATVAVGLFAQSWWHIAVPFACIGVAVGLIDTGAARAFADHVQLGRQGAAFGLKEASVPAASLLAGLALPTLAVTLGWRTAFVAAVAVAVVVLVTLPGRRLTTVAAAEMTTDTSAPVAGRAALVRFATGVGLGAGAATAGATFLVPSATTAGMSVSAAGALLSAASVLSITARIATGRWADRPAARPAALATFMMLAGALGALLLVAPPAAPVVVVGALLVMGGGWGWTGLAFLAAVRARPAAPAAAAGVVLTGLGIGGALGPFAFGALVERGSYPAAWGATAGALAVAAGLAASSIGAMSPRSGARAPGR